MKLFSTMLAAAFVAGSCTVAMAQGSGGSGAGGADQTQQVQPNKDADKNPSSPGAHPATGNTGSPTARTGGGTMAPSMAPASGGGLQTAPASNTRSDNPAKPAGANDTTGAKTGSGGSK